MRTASRRLTARPVVGALAVAAGLLAPPAIAAIHHYSAILNPRQETPPVTSNGMGGGRFIIDTDANTVTYWISFGNLTSNETLAHIHQGAPGVPGGVKFDLGTGNPKVGQWNYLEGDEAAILAGNMYANIHTVNNGGGELRGQIVPMNALLDSRQEVPVNASIGTGWTTAMVDTALNQITYRIFYENLTGPVTLAHFHGNANYGVSAGPKVTLTVTASPMIGTVVYNQADEAAMLSGRWYVNLHTGANPGGEVRGQFVPRVVPMDALQEVPPNGALSSAGFTLVAIDTAANVLGYDVRVQALSSAEQAAHIHGYAGFGANAPPLVTLAAGSPKIGTWNYPGVDEQHVLGGRTYVNIHTANNTGGEIRGQIIGLPGSEATTGVGEGAARPGLALSAAPNPSGGRTRLTLQLPRGGRASLAIVGIDGRRVRAIADGTFAPGPQAYDWDGRDDGGGEVAPGIYFAIAHTPDGMQVTRLARLR